MEELQKIVAEQTKKIETLENQSYILYLQLNALTKQLIEKGLIIKDELIKDMDELNDQLFKIANENLEETAPAETVAE